MSISLEHPPFFHGRHRRTVSVRTLDAMLESAICNTLSSRPSSISTQSSFSTAYTTLEAGQCFRYYLPHISTEEEGVWTRNDSYACNLSPTVPFKSLPPVDFGRFFHYMPDQSTEEDDVYTDGVNVMYDTMRGHGKLHVRPEQKMVSGFNDVDYNAPSANVASRLSLLGPNDFPQRPSIRVTEAVDVVDVGSYAAGERFGTTVAVDAGKDVKGKMAKEKQRRSMSLAGASEKVKDMLRKFHIGK